MDVLRAAGASALLPTNYHTNMTPEGWITCRKWHGCQELLLSEYLSRRAVCAP
ncbi:MAG TPA: hypothetical protein P5307_16255 [Pirellulaceae bacterium]|nr:hypothetical protein [Pirellulaceae bacterium]